jgi:C4-dicarboxylate transporter, DctM subunit
VKAALRAWLTRISQLDDAVAAGALLLMMLISLLEIAMRPLMGRGIENAPILVQHLGLVLAMFGALAAERHGHLSTLGGAGSSTGGFLKIFGQAAAALVCGMLALASWRFVASEIDTGHVLAYGLPVWWVQATMPLGFALLGFRLGARCVTDSWTKVIPGLLVPGAGWLLAHYADGIAMLLWPAALLLFATLIAGSPVFAILGGLALVLFWDSGLPLASVALSHYQITVNPSLPALPLFTLAGLVFAQTGAAQRTGALFVAMLGGGTTGTVLATAVLCSAFTAFTGGSGVTILALGGLLLPLLRSTGYPEQRSIGLVTSASALGVLLAPSVPLIMYAIIARVPIKTMFLAGLVPAAVMVLSLLLVGGYMRRPNTYQASATPSPDGSSLRLSLNAAWNAKWEILAPVVAIGSLVSGLATPTESAALTAAYAIATQAFAHQELPWSKLRVCLSTCVQLIGGVMVILGMALGLTNYLIDAGIPDAAIETIQNLIPDKLVFLLALAVFLLFAGALMEIYAAIVVLVPLLLPVAQSYGIDPIHFGIIFLAAMEMGFLCPPAGMNIYFASAMFGKPIRYVAVSVMPALLAILSGTLLISWWPALATALPNWLLG